jgi:SAM-dependent methyltransferase
VTIGHADHGGSAPDDRALYARVGTVSLAVFPRVDRALLPRVAKRHPREPDKPGQVEAAARTARSSATLVESRREDLTALTFDHASFDFSVSLEVLEHVPDYEAAFRECVRVLRPRETLLLTVPFHGGAQHLVRARIGHDGNMYISSPRVTTALLSPRMAASASTTSGGTL